MKKILSFIIAVMMLTMSLVSVSVSAEFTEENITIVTDLFDIKVTVISENAGTMTAILRNADKSISYGAASDRSPETIGAGGNIEYKYEFIFRMRSDVGTGAYAVTVGNNVAETTKTFTYVSLNDKIDFYGNLENTPVDEIKDYILNNTNVPVDADALDAYRSITDADILAFINAEIDALLLDPSITPVEGKTEDELKSEKIEELDGIFVPKFCELIELAQIALVSENDWGALSKQLIGATFDDYFYDADTEGKYFYTNKTSVLDVSEAFEYFATEREGVEEFTIAEYKKVFDKATLLYIENTRSFGTLKDAFIYFEEKGSIEPDMTNIQVLVDAENDFDLWSELGEIDNTDCAALLENAETIAARMIGENSGGSTGGASGGSSEIISNPTGSGGGGGLGGGLGGGSGSAGEATKPTTPEESEVQNSTFSDIENLEWAKEAIEALAKKGVINGRGDGKFAPNDIVTREEFVKIIIGAFDLLDEDAAAEFKDVDTSRWSYAFIATANELGIVTGDGETFNPSGVMSRQDMAVVIYRTAQKLGIELDGEAEGFTDADDFADYAKEAIEALTAGGIINGMGDGTFAPKATVTRAQSAKVIYGLMSLVGGGK